MGTRTEKDVISATPERITEKNVLFCDICGTEPPWFAIHKCLICGKDVCVDCQADMVKTDVAHWWHNDSETCVNRLRICKPCWKFGKHHREILNAEEEKFRETVAEEIRIWKQVVDPIGEKHDP